MESPARIAERSERKLMRLAKGQAGYFTAKQAAACGFRAEHHSYRCQKGHWLGVDKGLYRLPELGASWAESTLTCYPPMENRGAAVAVSEVPTAELRAALIRWLLWSRDSHETIQAVVSHETALLYYGLIDWADEPEREAAGSAGPGLPPIHLCVPKRFRKTSAAMAEVRLHPGLPPASDICQDGLIRVTAPARALREAAAAGVDVALARERARARGILGAQNLAQVGAVRTDGEFFRPAAAGETWFSPAGRAEEAAALGEPKRSPVMPNERERADRRRQAGFTLVELLVVTAIISVLAAMLLPVLDRSLAVARATSCANALKQLSLAGVQYADDNSGYIAINAWVDTSNGWANTYSWKMLLAPYVGIQGTGWKNRLPTDAEIYAQRGVIYGCPEYKLTDGASIYKCGYGTNVYPFKEYPGLGSVTIRSDFGSFRFMKAEEIRLPSSRALTVDADETFAVAESSLLGNGNYGFTITGNVRNGDPLRHFNNSMNIQFFDSHVKTAGCNNAYLTFVDPGRF